MMWIVKNRFAVSEIYAGIIKISQNLHTNSSCIFIMPVIIIYLFQCESYRRRKPMNAVCRDIFRAVHEGKWLSIEYRNQQEQVTRYWIGIRNIRPYQRTLEVDGLHLGCCAMEHFRCIYIDSILSSQIIEGSYCPVNPQLIRDISQNPQRYQNLFSHSVNLKILNYLEDCSRMDCTPCRRDFSLVHYLDRETLGNGIYPLSDDQLRLIVLCSTKNLERLHKERETETGDDLYELIRYVRSRGISHVTPKENQSRALGVKPFSTDTEEAFLEALNHALGNIWLSHTRFTVEKEVAVSQVFQENITGSDLFYSGRFDFVVYQRENQKKYPVLIIELDGKEHCESEIVKARDRKKNAICRAHGMELIRVENSYARRYQHIKAILEAYFKGSTMR